MLSQGRVAAPSGWCGPQRSEDTGQAGRILDAPRLITLSAGGRVERSDPKGYLPACHVANAGFGAAPQSFHNLFAGWLGGADAW
jgi:hypothetical protein